MPYRLFGSPIPLRCCFRSPLRFSGSRLPRNLTNTVHPLTDFGPSPELTPLALPLSKAMAYHFFSQGSFHEVLCPSSAQTLANRRIVRFHPNCLPPSVFLRPLRVCASLTPAALFRAAVTPGVHTLQSLYLPLNSTELIARRYPLDVSPKYRSTSTAPSGLFVKRKAVSISGVLHP